MATHHKLSTSKNASNESSDVCYHIFNISFGMILLYLEAIEHMRCTSHTLGSLITDAKTGVCPISEILNTAANDKSLVL